LKQNKKDIIVLLGAFKLFFFNFIHYAFLYNKKLKIKA
jgi:hypothetical protein